MAPQASLTLLLALLATASCVQAQRTQGQAPVTPPNFIRKNGLIKGDLVVLSVWSLLPDAPLPLSETNCAAACARTPGCNAYSYCPDSDGCGSGCLEYTSEHPQMQEIMSTWRPAPGASYNTPAWANLTTIDRFGPWGSTAYCGVPGKPRRADRWPHNMCMLKKVVPGVGNRAPAFEQDDEIEDDWRSGYLPTSTFQCGSLPLTTCYKCIGARDTKSCLRCANTVSPKLSLLAKVAGSTRMDFCDRDVSSLAAVTCLEENAPCAQCVTWKNQSRTAYNSSRCIDCLQAFPDQAFLPACQHCANLGTPALVDQCMACLEAMKPHACNATHTKDCWNPTLHAQSCAKCANSNATSNQQCVSCMQAKPASLMCDTCSALNVTDSQKALCYNCTVSTSAMGCNLCFKNELDTAHQQQCLACMVDPTISNVTKLFCADCAKSCATTVEYEQCIQCLGHTLPYNTSQACMCQKKVATPGFTTFHPPSHNGSLPGSTPSTATPTPSHHGHDIGVADGAPPTAGHTPNTTTNSTGTPGGNSSSPGPLTTREALINTTTPSPVDSTASAARSSTNGLATLRQRLRLDKRGAAAAAGATADGSSTASADAAAHTSTNGLAALRHRLGLDKRDASAAAVADTTAAGSSTASANATTVTSTSSVAPAGASSGSSTNASALPSASTTTAAPTNASEAVVSTPVSGPSSVASADASANASTTGSAGAADASAGASADVNTPTPLDSNITSVDVLPATKTTPMESVVANGTAGVVESPVPDADATAPAPLI